MKILLVGGVADSKAERVIKLIKEKCAARGVLVNVEHANVFNKNVGELIKKENPNVVVQLGTKVNLSIPVVDGLPFIYPQLGIDKAIDDILKYT